MIHQVPTNRHLFPAEKNTPTPEKPSGVAAAVRRQPAVGTLGEICSPRFQYKLVGGIPTPLKNMSS
jgi:hypothetical protein